MSPPEQISLLNKSELITNLGPVSDGVMRLYPDVTPGMSRCAEEMSLLVESFCEPIDASGGTIFMRGKAGHRLVVEAITGKLPIHDYMTSAVWSGLTADAGLGLSDDPVAKKLASHIPDLDWAVVLKKGIDIGQLYEAVVASVAQKRQESEVAVYMKELGGVGIISISFANMLKIDLHELPGSWIEADADCRVSWNLPGHQAFAGVLLRAGSFYCDSSAKKALLSRKALLNASRSTIVQGAVGFLRHLSHITWLDMQGLHMSDPDPINGGVNILDIFFDPGYWQAARGRTDAGVLLSRQDDVRAASLYLLTLNPLAFVRLLQLPGFAGQYKLSQYFKVSGLERAVHPRIYRRAYMQGTLTVNESGPVRIADLLGMSVSELARLCTLRETID